MNLARALERIGVPAEKARAIALQPPEHVTLDHLTHLDAEGQCVEAAKLFGFTPLPHYVRRRAQLADWPDLRLYGHGTALWWEAKSETDRLTRGQLDFLERELAHGALASAGGMAGLRALLTSVIRQDDPFTTARQLLAAMVRRGLRKE